MNRPRPSLSLVLLLAVSCASDEAWLPSLPTEDMRAQVVESRTLVLQCEPGDMLELETRVGALRVFPSGDGDPRLVVEATGFADDEETAARLARRVEVRVDTSHSVHRTILENLVSPGPRARSFVALSMTAFVPDGVRIRLRNQDGILEVRGAFRDLDLDTRYGDVAVEFAQGTIRAMTRSGRIELRSVIGEEVELETMQGPVEIVDLECRHLTVRTREGDIRLEGVDSLQTLLRSSYGRLELFGLRGDLVAQNKSGDVEIVGLTRGKHELETQHGAILIRGASGELRAQTTDGAVRIADFRGEADLESLHGDLTVHGRFSQLRAATASGRIRARCEPGSEVGIGWRLQSRHGEVSLGLPPDFAARLELAAAADHRRLDVAGSKLEDQDSHRLLARLGTGGERLAVSSDNGSVEVYQIPVAR